MYEPGKDSGSNTRNDTTGPGFDSTGFLANSTEPGLMPENEHSDQNQIQLSRDIGSFSSGQPFPMQDAPTYSFAPTEFNESHDLPNLSDLSGFQDQYPTWSQIGLPSTNPSSLHTYSEVLDPALYSGDVYQPGAPAPHQQLPFTHSGQNEMSFTQRYDENAWNRISHEDAISWQNTHVQDAPSDGRGANILSMPENPCRRSPVVIPRPSTLQHPSQGNTMMAIRHFGRPENSQSAGKIADKGAVKGILGNMARMDSRYRSYARDHLLDMNWGTSRVVDRTGRLHQMIEKRHKRARKDSRRKDSSRRKRCASTS